MLLQSHTIFPISSLTMQLFSFDFVIAAQYMHNTFTGPNFQISNISIMKRWAIHRVTNFEAGRTEISLLFVVEAKKWLAIVLVFRTG